MIKVRVILIAVMSLCGKISPGDLGSSEDRRFLEETRALSDASLLGAGTLREGDAEMRGPNGFLSDTRIRALITDSGQLPWEQRKIFQFGPRPLVFTAAQRVAALAARLGERAEVIALPAADQALDLKVACQDLHRRGVKKLLLEGGGGLNYQALRQGIVDELLITIAPKLSGDRQATSLLAGAGGPLGSPWLNLELVSCRPTRNGELFCRYLVKK